MNMKAFVGSCFKVVLDTYECVYSQSTTLVDQSKAQEKRKEKEEQFPSPLLPLVWSHLFLL